ncbi:group III truncated hemoglobin [Halocynthiibacter namhaensis]|uniref:group III truncated hemoglobin n=1 Tax=Halocynthiibacter namhaensis TaxID=1290553 RepID=UPI000578F07C|nr:group III truncated hemoglobin [Halocynthiibacter namhaensis]
MSNPLQRFPITPDEITRVMTRFYARIRLHPVLGPVFNGILGDDRAVWGEHEDKIAGFWRNALLREQSYSGNPMQVHLATPQILDEHFPLWLDLFEEVLTAELPPETAAAWGALAHRIARGFRMRMSEDRAPKDAPPQLSF